MKSAKFYVEAESWTTLGDTLACFNAVKRLGYTNVHFNFVTDPVHMRRVKLIWNMTQLEKGWAAAFFVAVEHRLSWKERYIREPIALLSYAIKLLPGMLFKK